MIIVTVCALVVGAALGAGFAEWRWRRRPPASRAPQAANRVESVPAPAQPAVLVSEEAGPGPEAGTETTGSPAAHGGSPPGATLQLPQQLLQADVATNLRVAEAVLDVADRLASHELCRRLGDALRPLAGLLILAPESGADFDPAAHDWVSTRPVTEGQRAGTVAATKVPGLANADGTVVRKVRIVVYE